MESISEISDHGDMQGNPDTHGKGCSSENPKHAMETLFIGDQGLG